MPPSPLPSSPLRLPRFRVLVVALAINTIGTWCGEIALAVLLLDRAQSPAAVAALWICAHLLPAPFVPAVVERCAGRRGAAPALLAGEALILGGLAAWSHAAPIPVILLLVLLDGIAALAVRSLIKTIAVAVVEPLGLLRAGNAIIVGTLSGCMAAGPVVAALLLGSAGLRAALLADALTFALAAVLLYRGARTAAASATEDVQPRALRRGFDAVWKRRRLRRLMAVHAFGCLFGALIAPVELVLVTDALHAAPSAYGLVVSSWGLGCVLGSVALRGIRDRSLQLLIVGALLLSVAAHLGMGLAGSVAVLCAFSILGGIANPAEIFAVATAMQEATPAALQARCIALADSIAAMAMGCGFALGGLIASLAGPRSVYVIAAGGLAAAMVISVRIPSARGLLVLRRALGPSAEADRA